MKYQVRKLKSLRLGLCELQPFVLNGRHLESGRPFKRFAGIRSRELLANWLICAVCDHVFGKGRFYPTSDPFGGDGAIFDSELVFSSLTEHVMVRPNCQQDQREVRELIVDAVTAKQHKGGASYASGKTLVVFLFGGCGKKWLPNEVAESLPQPLQFDAVWVVALQSVEDGSYSYGVTRLDLSRGNAPIWLVQISKCFESWDVTDLA